MKKRIVTLLFVAALGGIAALAAANEAKPVVKQVEGLTLDQALEMAESLQPELAEAKAMVEAAEGRAKQAGLFPNPEAVARMESARFRDPTGQAEIPVGISQAVPLGS